MTPSHGFRGKRHAPRRIRINRRLNQAIWPISASGSHGSVGPVGFFRTAAGIFRTPPGMGSGTNGKQDRLVF